MKLELNRNLLGVEDLLVGIGSVTQTRGGVEVTISKFNIGNLPFDETKTLAEILSEANIVSLGQHIDEMVIVANHIDLLEQIPGSITALQSIIDNLSYLLTLESNAATSASNAATSASNAATSESNAATSASNAATSESNAATSASNAATSESNTYSALADIISGATIVGKAADSDKLDGYDSTYFAPVSHNHDTAYLGITAKAADSDKLDGYDSSGFAKIGGNAGAVTLGTTDSTPVSLKVNNAEKVRVSTDGRVRIIAYANSGDNISGVDFAHEGNPETDIRAALRWGNNGSGQGYLQFLTGGVGGTGLAERARIDASGNLLVGVTTGSYHTFDKPVAEGDNPILLVKSSTAGGVTGYFSAVAATGWGATSTALAVGKNSTTGRSINAGGTVNTSGADYAEYMTKADGCGDIAKGDICGIDSNGLLTDRWADAVHFAVKSTNPSYVGGDSWGTEEIVGVKPVKPERREAVTEYRVIQEEQPASTILDEDGNPLTPAIPEIYGTVILEPAESEEEFVVRVAEYEVLLSEWAERHETERQKVDRIAFCGQVPVNITQFNVGDFIIPAPTEDGSITAIAIPEIDITFEQYKKVLGKVIAREIDGRARVIIK